MRFNQNQFIKLSIFLLLTFFSNFASADSSKKVKKNELFLGIGATNKVAPTDVEPSDKQLINYTGAGNANSVHLLSCPQIKNKNQRIFDFVKFKNMRRVHIRDKHFIFLSERDFNSSVLKKTNIDLESKISDFKSGVFWGQDKGAIKHFSQDTKSVGIDRYWSNIGKLAKFDVEVKKTLSLMYLNNAGSISKAKDQVSKVLQKNKCSSHQLKDIGSIELITGMPKGELTIFDVENINKYYFKKFFKSMNSSKDNNYLDSRNTAIEELQTFKLSSQGISRVLLLENELIKAASRWRGLNLGSKCELFVEAATNVCVGNLNAKDFYPEYIRRQYSSRQPEVEISPAGWTGISVIGGYVVTKILDKIPDLIPMPKPSPTKLQSLLNELHSTREKINGLQGSIVEGERQLADETGNPLGKLIFGPVLQTQRDELDHQQNREKRLEDLIFKEQNGYLPRRNSRKAPVQTHHFRPYNYDLLQAQKFLNTVWPKILTFIFKQARVCSNDITDIRYIKLPQHIKSEPKISISDSNNKNFQKCNVKSAIEGLRKLRIPNYMYYDHLSHLVEYRKKLFKITVRNSTKLVEATSRCSKHSSMMEFRDDDQENQCVNSALKAEGIEGGLEEIKAIDIVGKLSPFNRAKRIGSLKDGDICKTPIETELSHNKPLESKNENIKEVLKRLNANSTRVGISSGLFNFQEHEVSPNSKKKAPIDLKNKKSLKNRTINSKLFPNLNTVKSNVKRPIQACKINSDRLEFNSEFGAIMGRIGDSIPSNGSFDFLENLMKIN